MERKALFGRGSSLLISSPALVLFGAGVLLALRLGSGGVAGVCLFFLLLGWPPGGGGAEPYAASPSRWSAPAPGSFPGSRPSSSTIWRTGSLCR